MSQFSEGRYLSIISDADLSAVNATTGIPTNMFRVVSLASSAANTTGRKVVLATSTTDANIIGLLNSTPAAGDTASVCLRNGEGTFKGVIGVNSSGVSVNDLLTVDTDSGVITTTSSGDQLVGKAMEAGVAGQVIEILLINHKQQS